MFKNLVIFVIACMVVGCVSTPAIRFEPVSWEDVKIYYDKADVPGKFVKIATFRYEGEAIETTAEKQIEKMKKRAARIGANGIILKGMLDPDDLDAVAVIDETKIQAIAIRVK